MKKILSVGLAVIMLLSAFSLTALADNPETDGIYGVEVHDANVEIVFLKEDDSVIEASAATIDEKPVSFYAEAVKMRVTVTNASDQYYLVVAQNAAGVPTADNIIYIDQNSPSENTVTFIVYPSKLAVGENYIYLASTGSSITKVVTFKYYVSRMLGDVDGDGDVTLLDALLSLQIYAQIVTDPDQASIKAGDINGNGNIDLLDALQILQYYARIINDWN